MNLPYELVIQIASKLTPTDILSFIRVNSKLNQYALKDSFWSDLCRSNKIDYIHPDINYKTLYLSGDIPHMCHHIHNFHISDQKKEALWSFINKRYQAKEPQFFCLHPSCDYIGPFENHVQLHSIVLKMSMLHVLELWCTSCSKAIGFDRNNDIKTPGFRSEKYIMQHIVQSITLPTSDTILQGRRLVEYHLSQTQHRFDKMYMIDKKWYMTWLKFIFDQSNIIPDQLQNDHLLKSNGIDVRSDLVLGEDFELINGLTRWYIERVYGGSHIMSISDLPFHNPEYCRLLHKIKIRLQTRYYATPAIIMLQ